MSESKRFKLSEIYSNTIMDTENCVNNGSHCRIYDIEEVVDLLNKLVKDNEELGISIKLFEDDITTKDKKIEEHQATIKKLQDLCGESDSENAKLRIENKELQEEIKLLKPVNIEQYEQIVQLQEENEQLRLELDTHKHPLWSTREAEKKVNKLSDSLADEIKKNGLLNEEINQLRIENMRLKKKVEKE